MFQNHLLNFFFKLHLDFQFLPSLSYFTLLSVISNLYNTFWIQRR